MVTKSKKGAKWLLALAIIVVLAFASYFLGLARRYNFAEYREHLDLIGKDVIGLAGATREKARVLFPMVKEPSAMQSRVAFFGAYRAYNGELADEVHIFRDARQGDQRITRLLLRQGRVIEVTFRFGE